MKRIINILGCLCLSCSSLLALEIVVSPGKLVESRLMIVNTTDETLTLRGDADVRDFEILSDVPSQIVTLDISELNICGYSYAKGDYYGQTTFTANELPMYSFIGSNFQKIILPKSLTSIEESAFASSSIVSLDIPSSISSIHDSAFSWCPDLTTVIIHGSPVFGKGLFKECCNLKEVKFEQNVTDIPDQMFDGCSNLNLTIPATVEQIGAYAFRNTGITCVNLNGVKEVGDYAFSDVKDLEEIILSGDSRPAFGKGVFFNSKGVSIFLCVFNDLSALSFAHASNLSAVTIGATKIGEGAFANNAELEHVKLESTVTAIEAHAFRNDFNLSSVDALFLAERIPETDMQSFSGLENAENRYDITLQVKKGTEKTWKAHPLWSLFDIQAEETGIGDINDNAIDIEVKGENGTITISSNELISSIEVYSTNGIKIYSAINCGDNHVVDALGTGTFVVSVKSGAYVKIVKLLL